MNTSATVMTAEATVTSCVELMRESIDPVRQTLLRHCIYSAVDSLPRLRIFMSHHVFAVWDFMCLAKRLQRDLTSLDKLWLPPARPSLARFINSVVHEEESDVDATGAPASHFDLYLAAMDEVGASTAQIQNFVSIIAETSNLQTALSGADAPAAVNAFVSHTLNTVERGTTIEVLSSLLFGREDLIPQMFSRLIPRWAGSLEVSKFTYYVERHIALDGDEHGPAGERALENMISANHLAMHAAERAAKSAIEARIALWDGIIRALRTV